MIERDDVLIPVLLPVKTAEFANWLGNDGVLIILESRLRELEAEDFAEKNDEMCFSLLLEACYLRDVVYDFVEAKRQLEMEVTKL